MRFNVALLIITALLAQACTNGRPKARATTTAANSTQSNGQVANVKATYKISSIDITVPTTTGATVDSVTIRLDNSAPFTDFTTFCSLDGGTNPCVCYFKWSEVNPNSVFTVTIPRYVETPITLIQPSLAQCDSPDGWEQEVKDGTTVQVGMKPSSGLSEFAMPAYNYVKNPSTSQGDFTDAAGHAFDNILHYSCYEQFLKGTAILNKLGKLTSTQGAVTTTINAPFANDFCLVNVENGGATQDCPTITSTVDYSAESNYYNLYTRAADRGTINGNSNGRYSCPVVEEPLSGNAQATFWPLDSNFALSMSPNPDFSVAVEGFTKLSFGDDPKSQATTCYSQTGATGGSTTTPGDTILTGCLGFASKPKVDGTCNTFKDAANNTKSQFRLRRYVAVYPPSYEADGQPYRQGQATDVIYVLDRPVTNPADPTKPFSMLGPKPCPFSYFDYHEAVATTPGYIGTSDTGWNGKNYDNLQFPNVDTATSCSAMVAIPNFNKTRVSFATVNVNSPIQTATSPSIALNKVFIRPVKPWAPHYEEDTNFLACAPQSTPVRDPPLHFARDAQGQVSYCAEAYPTQNGNADKLDLTSGTPGSVVNFTSHQAKNSISPPCTGRKPAGLSNTYTAGPALHNNGTTLAGVGGLGLDGPATTTCDRTIPASQDAFFRVPLTESATQVEAAILADPSYRCTVTWDNGGTKRNKATPLGGCCGPAVAFGAATGAHLEPAGDASVPTVCATPAY